MKTLLKAKWLHRELESDMDTSSDLKQNPDLKKNPLVNYLKIFQNQHKVVTLLYRGLIISFSGFIILLSFLIFTVFDSLPRLKGSHIMSSNVARYSGLGSFWHMTTYTII